MTIQEKIQIASELSMLTLFKEGMFYKCYNEDVMVFTRSVKAYKISCKYVKTVSSEVLSIGFPAQEAGPNAKLLAEIATKLGVVSFEDLDNRVVYALTVGQKTGYTYWLASLSNQQPEIVSEQIEVPGRENNLNLLGLIEKFDLANSTPMQCMSFIQLLKQKVLKKEGNYGDI